jgi:mono/diheme cytochrome c family protein
METKYTPRVSEQMRRNEQISLMQAAFRSRQTGGALVFSLAAGLISVLLVEVGCQESLVKAPEAAPAKLSFNEHVEPILAENCFGCHGPDPGSRKAGLRLDRAEFAFAPHEKSGPAIVRFQPDKSPLVQRIESKVEKEMMPPPEAHKTLKREEVALLRRWVSEGAEYEEHWSFIPPVARRPPAVPAALAGSIRNPVDQFIVARLEKEGLAPSPEADRRSLLRRVTLDLTGLPPSPAEMDAFLADSAAGAYERVIDRLLASPRFGEQRAHYWLDYVRYADTHGIHFDNYRAIWPYRDYVIRAFNADKPFDRFVREQLAGDLLPARTWDELAATGFMRCNLTTNEGGDIPEETYVNQTRDRVETFGVTFLGLTTGCAACHDHKFDPFTQRDFYRLAAYLNNTAEKPWDSNIADPAPVLRLPKDEDRITAEVVLTRRADFQERLDARRRRGRELVTAWLATGHRPMAVSPDALELRLRLDEGQGDVVRNTAPAAAMREFKADTNPLVWGENSWLWPSMRMDILTRLRLGSLGDVEADDKFSAGAWLMLREKPGNGNTGDGSLLSRMGDGRHRNGAGWEIYQEKQHFIVNLVPALETSEPAAAVPVPAQGATAGRDEENAEGDAASKPKRGLSVSSKDAFPRDEWLHVFFTYDGSRKAAGVKLYVNGRPAATDEVLNEMTAHGSIRTDAAMQLGRRDDFRPMRETRFQDVRFYRRALTPEEVARLPFEDVAAEIVARKSNPSTWSRDEAFVVTDRWFLGEVDPEAMKLAAAVDNHTGALEALTKDGEPTLIAVEKPTPAYADTLKRGDYYSRIERVGPGTPHFLPPPPAGAPEDRRGLADWLLAPEQPLFARVTVNRMWEEIFGTGLVESAGDFGIMGTKPSHPELLDWLAVRFRESGWDVKQFYRLLVTSATYRQSSAFTPDRLAKDPANRLLSRGPRFRMDAEMLRDSALAVSGLLVEKVGGPSVKPYQPADLWEEVAMPESNTRTYVADHGEGLYRRSVYTFWKRGSMPPSMEAFDAVSRENVCPRRARTDTPLQAFVTMNDPQWVEAARQLAQRTLHAEASTDGRLKLMARTALGRTLDPREEAVFQRSMDEFRAYFGPHPEAAREILAVGESPVDATLAPGELAEWTMVASQFLNLDEFLTK